MGTFTDPVKSKMRASPFKTGLRRLRLMITLRLELRVIYVSPILKTPHSAIMLMIQRKALL